MTGLDFAVQLNESPVPEVRRTEILAHPGFGKVFTDHMVSVTWTPGEGWHDARLQPYGPLSLDPATATIHYAQSVFEGLKAYRQPGGGVATFRPEANALRFQRSARRLALPELPVEHFIQAIDLLVSTDERWVPAEVEKSLYVRPFMFATEVFLGVKPASDVTFMVICSPAGAYFPKGLKPVSIWLSEDYSRAAPGGTGAAKCAGNYAASLIAQQEAIEQGCDQVAFLDAVERRWVEELGGMNLYFVHEDGSLVTPELTGSILEGVTRDSVLRLATDLGLEVEERRVDIDEWRKGVSSGRITEVFACGTAAVITPVGLLKWRGGELPIGSGEPGEVTSKLRTSLMNIQYGLAPDTYGWLHPIL